MPYKYQFKDNNPGGKHFDCQLQCDRCTYVNETTQRQCRRNVCIGLRMCWQYTIMVSHLRIKQSTNPDAGKGLFVQSKDHANNEVVFRINNVICSYVGEHMSNRQMDQRYGNKTANYATQGIRRNDNIDSACLRGIGSLINHSNMPNAEIQLNRVARRRVVQVVALGDITNGQEIFINYGPDYMFNEPNVTAVTKTGRIRER